MPMICTMVVKDNLFIGGGMKGEIICKVVHSSSPSTSFPILDVKQIIPTRCDPSLRFSQVPVCY
jgi:hypothetical protein